MGDCLHPDGPSATPFTRTRMAPPASRWGTADRLALPGRVGDAPARHRDGCGPADPARSSGGSRGRCPSWSRSTTWAEPSSASASDPGSPARSPAAEAACRTSTPVRVLGFVQQPRQRVPSPSWAGSVAVAVGWCPLSSSCFWVQFSTERGTTARFPDFPSGRVRGASRVTASGVSTHLHPGVFLPAKEEIRSTCR